MVKWEFLAILAVFALITYKFREVGHRARLLTLTAVSIFFTLTIVFVYTQNNIDITTFQGIITTAKVYLSWLGQLANNGVKIVGQVIKMDWIGNVTSNVTS